MVGIFCVACCYHCLWNMMSQHLLQSYIRTVYLHLNSSKLRDLSGNAMHDVTPPPYHLNERQGSALHSVSIAIPPVSVVGPCHWAASNLRRAASRPLLFYQHHYCHSQGQQRWATLPMMPCATLLLRSCHPELLRCRLSFLYWWFIIYRVWSVQMLLWVVLSLPPSTLPSVSSWLWFDYCPLMQSSSIISVAKLPTGPMYQNPNFPMADITGLCWLPRHLLTKKH